MESHLAALFSVASFPVAVSLVSFSAINEGLQYTNDVFLDLNTFFFFFLLYRSSVPKPVNGAQSVYK